MDKKPIKWKCNETFTFIVLLRPHPCLWDSRHADFTNHSARKQALSNVLRKLAMPRVYEKEANNKINSIRRIYHMELYKLLADEDYKPRAFWFKVADAFMREAALKPDWIILPKRIVDDSQYIRSTCPGPDLTRFALESYSSYTTLRPSQQRLYRQAVSMILNELLEEQEDKQ